MDEDRIGLRVRGQVIGFFIGRTLEIGHMRDLRGTGRVVLRDVEVRRIEV